LVQVQVVNGSVYQGILHAIAPNKDKKGMDVHLRMAYNKPGPSGTCDLIFCLFVYLFVWAAMTNSILAL
jgi:hypothetical protein